MPPKRIKPGGKVFRDPVHNLIHIDCNDEFVLDLIDTPEFQRLRRIRQLGVSSLTFHGAEHSRFVHSLGVFNFAQRIMESLSRRYAGSEVADYLRTHAKTVKAAALLHDIGHGPFSHMIERAFSSTGHHEKKTVEIIRSEDSAVAKVLRGHGVDRDAVAQLIDHTSSEQLLIDIVSSQLDADRMDYLLRDSYCTGVQYGLYDAEWILNAMCVGRDQGIQTGESAAWRLCLDARRGEKAAEQFILARSHMNEQVYFHRVTRGFEALLLALFREATRLASTDSLPTSTPGPALEFFKNKGRLSSDSWLGFDESQLFVAMHAWSESSEVGAVRLRSWSRAFLRRERPFISVGLPPGSSPLIAMRLTQALNDLKLVEGTNWHTDDIASSIYKGVLYSAAKPQDAEEQRLESIFLASGKPKEPAIPIEVNSNLINSLDTQRSSMTRFYFDRSVLDRIEPILQKFKLRIDSEGATV